MRFCVCEDQPRCRMVSEGKCKSKQGTALSPVNAPRGAFIWVVIISAKPTKCLQPTSRRCTRCKTRYCVFLSQASLSVCLSPLPFLFYIHTLVTLQTHAFIIFPYLIHKILQPLVKEVL